ncbi:hypothetical protein INS49_006524 [Diaporthe citri]|uniref:uncharacterized protein n=1 Tax=Diaporthe citri TaxID=83186 RepID=UPI001C7F1FD2|nr:uncharacterized protein INS49_006524 [Diaporthe citri]KAG6364920.1 hypothetical protein INS49_006524 [Diaporthe citri]
MKTDQYLNLCLDQAALSTLHYRHGCVVVKGGKVIGQGFNDCRPGYDGGSVLKTGALPKAAANVQPDKPDPPKHKSDFKAVESVIGNCGGGHHANAYLTMHSEMMAINSALSSRSTLAANTVSHVKPSFKLLGDSKRKRELQRNAVLSYAQAVCLATFGQEVQQGAGAAEADGHHSYQYQKEKGYKNKYKYKYNKYKYKPAKGSKDVPAAGSMAQKSEDSDSDIAVSGEEDVPQDATESNKSKFGLRKARNQHLLVPKGRTVGTSPGVKERMKHPKLVGADVYVARLANDGPSAETMKKRRAHNQPSDETVETASPDTCTTTSAVSAETGSLHDELIMKTSKSKPLPSISEDVKRPPTPAESRPCYRCVAYMHSVGIKRVFWTTNDGKWEGAKVRDLIDQLDGTMRSDTDTTLGQAAMDVFVTKHEVLMLRRLMGGEG